MKNLKAAVSHYEQLIKALCANARFAHDYLTAAIGDADSRVLLVALRTVVEARGMARVGERAGIPRHGLYRTLSAKEGPRLTTLLAVLKATGLRFSPEERKQRAA